MKKLFSKSDFKKAKSKDKLPLKCCNCDKIFYRTKHLIKMFLNPKQLKTGDFCSNNCKYINQKTSIIVSCKNCKAEFHKTKYQIKKHPNHFCSQSCSAIYNNKHKTHGIRRSKLEAWIEEQLTVLYPNIEIHYNRKNAINSELDIYIPSLKLAFELNGIFHYEPIYGEEKLSKIQNNDNRKFQACIENNIELCIIDSSKLTYFKPKNAEKFLSIINEIINNKI